jgi:hypothetical protein
MRKPVQPTVRPQRLKSFPAPVGGWIRNQSLAVPNARKPDGSALNGAFVIENWFPTATGLRMRRGSLTFNRLGSMTENVVSLFSYVNASNQKLFGATPTGIFDATNAAVQTHYTDGSGNVFVDDQGNKFIPFISSIGASVSGLTSGDWSSVQFANSSGDVFLDLVNGSDSKLLYDGTDFYPIGSTSLYSISYNTETQPFTVGKTLTGATSAATATIVKVIDNGTTGTLWVDNVTGTFGASEIITDDNTTPGSATTAGAPVLLFNGITGVSTSSLSYNWTYKNRIFYVEKNSLNAWYLPVDSVTGTATLLPLAGIFQRGGSLLFGAAWSLETLGGGLSEQCIFVTTEGEIAVFQGTDPSVADSWAKVGVYRTGRPLGAKAHIKAGGDVVMATDIGFLPVSASLTRDYAALSPVAVSYPIEVAWNEYVANRSFAAWTCEVWPSQQMMAITMPSPIGSTPTMLVANVRTGAWAPYTGWNAFCVLSFQGRMFFGSDNGRIIEAEVTGADDGLPYTASCVPLFDPLKAPASLKTGLLARSTLLASADIAPQLSLQADYQIALPPSPSAAQMPGGNTWDSGVWNVSKWDQVGQKSTKQQWQSVGGAGYALSPAVQITSGSLVPLDVELVSVDLTYDLADIVT